MLITGGAWGGWGCVKWKTAGSAMENYSMRNTHNNFSEFHMSIVLKLHSIPITSGIIE